MKRLFQKEHLQEKFLNFLLRSVPGAVLISKDIAFKEVIHNLNAAAFLRIQPWETFSYASKPPFKIFSKGLEVKALLLPMRRAVEFGEIIDNEEFKFVWPDGVSKTALFSARPLEDKDGKIVGAIAKMEDITARKQIEEELRASEERYRLIFENSMDAIILTTPDGQFHHANPAACELFQRTEEEICAIGRQAILDTSDPMFNILLKEREIHGKSRHELTMVRKDGTKFPAVVSSSVFEDRLGHKKAINIVHDITRLKQVEISLREAKEEAERLATFDDLTGALNRRAFMKRLEEEINRTKRQKTSTGLILMDIDLFKVVNDTYGHQVGDFVLQKFCICITQSLRSYDFFGRYGGEEFIVCLPNANLNETAIVAERMRREVEQSDIVNNSLHISVTASFGVAHLNYSSQENMDSFISRADNAMYNAKSKRNIVCISDIKK